jgi:DNA-binding NarL/FixJ family response regulator
VITLLTNDLMFQSRVSGAVRAAGKQLIVDRSVSKICERAVPSESVSLIMIDLSLQPLALGEVVPTLRTAFPTAKILAFGAHVDVDRLEEAEQAGADMVLTRGQFDRDLSAIVSQ